MLQQPDNKIRANFSRILVSYRNLPIQIFTILILVAVILSGNAPAQTSTENSTSAAKTGRNSVTKIDDDSMPSEVKYESPGIFETAYKAVFGDPERPPSLVTINVNSVAVTATTPTASDNDYTRINNAIIAAAPGDTIMLNGTFDWTETNAAASWALGSDGTASTGDDYSIDVPANKSGVVLTASSLGVATIQGPGDLAAVNLEGVFVFRGGDNQNWTISNLRFLDFDLSIGMFNGAGGTDAFNGTIIQNNYIRIPNDLNAVVAPADVIQNIGIHYSFGTNQLISGNTIETAGDGISASPNFSSVAGMQSNTSGGAVYDGLQITNNIVRVLNAQNNANPQVFLGIWENAHAHSSNITVSGNQFLNMAGGNSPSLNLQRGFRVTSHSSATTTVEYLNNSVEGANIGFQWLSTGATTNPIKLTSNRIVNNAIGLRLQTNAQLDAKYNRIVGNSTTGIDNNTTPGLLVTANDNWWGCNFGPATGGAGCVGTPNGTTGAVTASTYLVLKTNVAPTSTKFGGTPSTVTADLTFNNTPTVAGGNVPDTTPASFATSTPLLGGVSPTSGTLTSGLLNSTFTALNSAGVATVSSTVDGQTITANINVNPIVTSIKRKTPLGQYVTASPVVYEVIFNSPVKNVDDTDFNVNLVTGTVTGLSVTAVSSANPFTTYQVTVTFTGGEGEIRLDLIDDNSILQRTTNIPLGGPVAGDGDFTTGETYIIDVNPPTVTIKQNPGQADSTSASSIVFDVLFSESVGISFATGDVSTAGSSAGGTLLATVTGTGPAYTVTVTGMMSSGTVVVNIPASVAQDLSGKNNTASTTGLTINDDNIVNYFTGAITLVVDKDGSASATDCSAAVPAYTTIQSAINAASAGYTIKVCGGTYTENLTVNKQLSILGPNAAIDPNTGSRITPEAVIETAVKDTNPLDCNDTQNSFVVNVTADGVIFKGFTINGDNPLLTSNYVFNGADIDAYGGIVGTGTVNPNADISYNIVKNTGEYGIELYGDANAVGARTTNSNISNNKVDNVVGICYGNAIAAELNGFANITDNVVTQSFGGVSIQHTNGNATSRPNSTVSNNSLTTFGYPVWFNLHYGYSTNGYTISNNTINSYIQADLPPIAPPLADSSADKTEKIERMDRRDKSNTPDSVLGWDRFIGVRIESVNMAPVTVSNNTIVPNKAALMGDGYTVIDGMRITNPSTNSANINITGNTIRNTKRGIAHTAANVVPNVTCNNFLANDVGIYIGSGFDYDNNPESATSGILANNNSIVGNTNFGVQALTGTSTVNNATSNYWGAANGAGPIGTGLGDKVTTLLNFGSPLTAPGCAPAVTYPTVTINKASGQNDPGNTSPINFTVTFSESVTGFTTSDLKLSGTAPGTLTAVVTGGPTTYNVAVSGMTGSGTVIAEVYAGGGLNASGIPSVASTSTDNNVLYDVDAPTVTVNTSAPNPTNVSPISFTIDFNETMVGFTSGDLTIVNGTVATFTDNLDTTYTVTITPTAQGTVSLSVGAGVATDVALNPNLASNVASVVYDSIAPTVTIDRAMGQADSTSTSPINFKVSFNENVTGFTLADVTLSGTAGATTASITGGPMDYNVAVIGMTSSGTVIISVANPAAADAAGNNSGTPIITDDTVNFTLVDTPVTVNPTNTGPAPPAAGTITRWWGFNDVTNAVTPPSYVEGPATPTAGTGSARLNTTATGKYLFFSNHFNSAAALPLSQITALRYSSYANDPTNPANLPSLQMGIDFDSTDGNTGFQGRLVFEPADNQTSPNQPVAQNTWQTWDATNGTIWFTQIPANNICGNLNRCSMATALTTYERLNIPNTAFGFIGFRSTGGGVNAVENYVDKFTIGINSANTTFNFEATPPTLSINDVTVTEGNAGTVTATFTVTQSVISQLDTTVVVNTADDTATTADSDYAAVVNQTVTIPAGSLSNTTDLVVTVNGDTIDEPNQQFFVNLTNAVNASILDAQGIGTINDNDPAPIVSIVKDAPLSLTELNSGTQTSTFTVSLSNASSSAITVSVTAGGTASTPGDFTMSPASLTFPANSTTSQTVTATINGDTVDEPDETFTATIAVTGGTATLDPLATTATGTILDDDNAPVISIVKDAPTSLLELNSGTQTSTFTVSLSNASSLPITVSVTAGGTASTPGDFTMSPASLTFPANSTTSQTVTATIVGDTLVESNETFTATIAVTGGTATLDPLATTASGTITNDDAFGSLQFSSATYGVTEGTPTATTNVTRTGGSAQVVSVSYATSNGTALSGAFTPTSGDYTSTSSTLSWADGETVTKSFTIPINDDIISEVPETVNLTLSSPLGGATLGSQSTAVLTITDNDGGGLVSISGNIQQYNAPSPNTNLAGVTVTLSGSATGTFTTLADGNYTFTGLPAGGTFLVTPSQAGKVFEPINRSYGSLFTSVSNANFVAYNVGSVPRTIALVNSYTAPGTPVAVPITLTGLGNETDLSFSLAYDSTLLSITSASQVACGSGATGCTLTVNFLTPGQLGVTLEHPTSFTAGTTQAVVVTFNTTVNPPNTASNTPVTFTNTPAVREVNDVNANPLPSNYTPAFVVFAQGLEADVAGRNTGNGGVAATDVAQIRRFSVGLDTPDVNFNEFQRADCAPIGSFGNGIIASADVSQSRRYSVGLDPSQPAAGPFSFIPPPPIAPEDPLGLNENRNNLLPRVVRVVPISTSAGAVVIVSIEVDAEGDENNYNFSYNYDSTKLMNPVVTIGSGATGGNVLPNTNVIGKIGFNVDFGGSTIPAGNNRQLVTVTFNVANNAPAGTTPLTSSDSPAFREISNLAAQSLAATFASGDVTINPPTAATVNVAGRVITASGQGIAKARVVMTNSNGETQMAVSNPLGYFRFEGIPAGESYVIGINSKQYTFATQTVNVTGDITDLNFTAEP